MTTSELEEKLSHLFLRLNGYFVSGLIIHSKRSKEIAAEIDLVAVRFKNHEQLDRDIGFCEALDIPQKSDLDVLIIEVKGGNPSSYKFNSSILNNDDRRKKLLSWVGIFDIAHLDKVNTQLKVAMKSSTQKGLNSKFQEVSYKSNEKTTSLRPIIFGFSTADFGKRNILSGTEIFDYCEKCFCPVGVRNECATDYVSTHCWGLEFRDIVKYFKNSNKRSLRGLKDLLCD
jgi:hypothetical protein